MFADAVVHYQRALALDPDYPQVHSNLGTTLLAQGKLHEAIVHYERALVLGPNYAGAHKNLGLALHRQGKFADAVAHYQRPRALALDPDYAQVVTDMDRQVRRIVAYCGLERDDACMAFHATQREVRTSSAAQVRQPIYHTSVGRWRPYGDLLQPLIEALGLAPRAVPAPSVAAAGMTENAPR
jgi:tetratricopeptide (TPR) repeat protein